MATTALSTTPRDIALAAIETELEAALLTSKIVTRTLYYIPHAGHFEVVASTIRAWALRHKFAVTERFDDLQHTLVVADDDQRQVVKVFQMLEGATA
jgi:hypothetical protein